jgi:ankyrin repeat protein
MIQPVEMRKSLPIGLHGGVRSTTTEVWQTLSASRDGDLDRVKALCAIQSELSTCQYNYTPPLHFAVREGHEALVRELVERGALDPTYTSYPFQDSLVTMATDRGHDEIAKFVTECLANPQMTQKKGDTGAIDYGMDAAQRRFEKAVHGNDLREAERLLKERPELASEETASWGEGVLAVPANRGWREMLELLMRYGARVPDVSKWAREYYFKHYDIAAFLIASGMNPNHMNWQHVTLLHDMAQRGNIPKARLLLDHGAEINPVDEEYRSTPLGLAARWGHRNMVAFLLERGADAAKAGARWATPLAWARKKGFNEIANDLNVGGSHA